MLNTDLLFYHNEFQKRDRENYFNRGKIAEFYKEHGGRINSLNEKVIAIQEKYFQTDGFNQRNQLKIKQEQEFIEKVEKKKVWLFFTKKVKIKVPGKMKYLMKEGMNIEDYQKEMNALMMQDIVPIHTMDIKTNGLKIVSK